MPFGVITPFCWVDTGREKFRTPWRRFFFVRLKDDVVGVAGGEEGPACWAKLKLGVVGRIAIVVRGFDPRLLSRSRRSRGQRPWKVSPARREKTRRIAVHDKLGERVDTRDLVNV